MFCMNCGQVLPDGAKFCLNCGTPQGAVSSTESSSSEVLTKFKSSAFVPAMCPNCNSHMSIDSTLKTARCNTCGTECLVQDAINALTVRGNVQVGSATINVSGTNTDSLLQRVEIMLADGDFKGAMSKCDTILDSDPKNGKVYLYMLMSDLSCKSKLDLSELERPFDRNQYYIKAMQYGDNKLKEELQRYIDTVNARIVAKREADLFINLITGESFPFGKDGNGNQMRWSVLAIHNRKALILCDENVCDMPYHQSGGSVTWKECTLRKWLNNVFYNSFFSEKERTRIISQELTNSKNPKYNTSGGESTTDYIFLLSIGEAESLHHQDIELANGTCWWLRSPGEDSESAAGVIDDGGITACGDVVDNYHGVRPAMWIKTDP